jgi:hypothetical protein
MMLHLGLPDGVLEQFLEPGQDVSRAVLEALAIDAYRAGGLIGHQLRQLIGISSRYDLDGFLKHHGVELEHTIEDFERDRETSTRLWEKRQSELSAQPPSE